MKVHLPFDQDRLAEFCRRWRIVRLSLFGSVLRDDFGPESDVDVLVMFEQGAPWSLWDLSTMKDELESMFGRSVDLVEEDSIRNPYRRRTIMESREVIFAA